MKTLLVLRHAKSSWGNMQLGDHERPLNKRGKRDAPRMGQLLKQESLTPHLIISSTAERAMQTAELIAITADYERKLLYTRDLYLADPDSILDILRGVDDEHERVMVVAHNPGMEMLVDLLTGESVYFTTANIAHIQLPIDSWAALDDSTEGKLLDLWRPKELNE